MTADADQEPRMNVLAVAAQDGGGEGGRRRITDRLACKPDVIVASHSSLDPGGATARRRVVVLLLLRCLRPLQRRRLGLVVAQRSDWHRIRHDLKWKHAAILDRVAASAVLMSIANARLTATIPNIIGIRTHPPFQP